MTASLPRASFRLASLCAAALSIWACGDPPAGDSDEDILAQGAFTLSGRVLDTNGNPVVAATVEAFAVNGDSRGASLASVSTGADGRYELRSPTLEDNLEIFVVTRAAGYVESEARVALSAERATTRDINLEEEAILSPMRAEPNEVSFGSASTSKLVLIETDDQWAMSQGMAGANLDVTATASESWLTANFESTGRGDVQLGNRGETLRLELDRMALPAGTEALSAEVVLTSNAGNLIIPVTVER